MIVSFVDAIKEFRNKIPDICRLPMVPINKKHQNKLWIL